MILKDFQNIKLSALGLGCMRLPMKDGKIDEEQVSEMVKYAIENGINYFDTAYPYHNGLSEIIIGKELKKYPKDKWYLANKYPGHQIADTYYPEEIFEEQLKKCGVDYFDFYLLHNVYENSFDIYTDKKWSIPEYFVKQKELGRIKHLGFSFHGEPDLLVKFLDIYGSEMEFCQIQMNYLDWTLQDAKQKYQILSDRNIPCWVMEPLRGGKLANIPNKAADTLNKEENWSSAEWAFRFLLSMPNVKMILSGMSSMEQIKDNVNIFGEDKIFEERHKKILLEIAEPIKDSVPCTKCGYCLASCPQKLNIPKFIEQYNDIRFANSFWVGMKIDELEDNRKPSACIRCGACSRQCPQQIDIPKTLEELTEKLKTMPSWKELCKERNRIAAEMKEQNR